MSARDRKKIASLPSYWNKFLIRSKWLTKSKHGIYVFLPFQYHKICVQPSSQRGSSRGKLLFIHCLGRMAHFRYLLVVRTWKKEISWVFVWSWVFSKNYIYRYQSSVGRTDFVDTFFFSFCEAGPNPPQSLQIFESRRKGIQDCLHVFWPTFWSSICYCICSASVFTS